MIKSSLCGFSDTCIHVKGTITISITAPACAAVNNGNKKVMFKNGALFTDCVRGTNDI